MELSEILDRLVEVFDEPALRRVAASLDVAYEYVPGESTREKLRELVGYADRQGRMTDLAGAMLDLEPDLAPLLATLTGAEDDGLSWLQQATADSADPVGAAVTMQWARPQPDPPEDQPNPYTPGVAVDDPSMFFGRDAELDLLLGRLMRGGHTAVVGTSRIGVSSLLRALGRRLAEDETRLVPAYLDLASDRLDSLATLIQSMWAQWWMQIRPGNVPAVDGLEVLATLIQKIAAAGYRPVLLLDEFEQIAWRVPVFGAELFAVLARLARDGHLLLITGSQESPADLMLRAGLNSDLYRVLQRFDLGLLDVEAARDLLIVPLHAAAQEPDHNNVARLLDLAGPHPFYLQLAGRLLYDTLAQPDYAPADVGVRFRVAAEPFWADLWESLTPLAQAALLPEAEGVGVMPPGRTNHQLEVRGVVVPAEDGYRPFSEGFAIWLAAQEAGRTFQPAKPSDVNHTPPAA